MAGSDVDPNGPAGPQPSRADKRWYFALMGTCIGLFVLAWAVSVLIWKVRRIEERYDGNAGPAAPSHSAIGARQA